MSRPRPVARNEHGSIILLCLMLVVGCIIAVGLPNLIRAVQRGKQRRTMADLRSISLAVETYQVERGCLPPVLGEDVDIEVLVPHVQPTYIKQLPLRDGWGSSFRWHRADAGGYSIVSLGKDARADLVLTPGATTGFSSDLYLSDGGFSIFPEGTMQ